LTRGGTTADPKADSAGVGAPTDALSADQVERQVSLRQAVRPPRYPAALRASGIEGEVIALFIVGEAGRVEAASIRFVRSDHVLFEAAVREALDTMRFNAAEVGGKRVRQLVQMPFVFTLSR
jgi:periplasmic protein TonB